MRYRLKNRALQAALDKATNGAFSELLLECEGVTIEVNGVKQEIAELWDEYSDEKLLQKLLHADRYGFGKTEADEIRSLLKRVNDWMHIDEV